MYAFVGGKVLGARLGFHRLSDDRVAIVVVDDEEVGSAGAGGGNEATSGVRKYLSGDGLTIGEDGVCAKCWRVSVGRA